MPKPIVQSQESVQPQHHMPIPLPPTLTNRPYMHDTALKKYRPENSTKANSALLQSVCETSTKTP